MNFAQINGSIYCKTHYLQLFAKRGTYSDFQGHNPSAWETKNAAAKAAESSSATALQGSVSTETTSNAPDAASAPENKGQAVNSPTQSSVVSSDNATPASPTNTADVSSNQSDVNPLTGIAKRDIRSIYNPASSSKESQAPVASKSTKSTGAFSFLGGGGIKCSACNKSVYSADPQVTDKGLTWHKSCFKCAICKGQIVLSHLCQIEGAICCKACFKKTFSTRGNYDDVLVALGKEVKRPQNAQAQGIKSESTQESAPTLTQEPANEPAKEPTNESAEVPVNSENHREDSASSASASEAKQEDYSATDDKGVPEAKAAEINDIKSEVSIVATGNTEDDANAEAVPEATDAEIAGIVGSETLIAEKLDTSVVTESVDNTSPTEVNDSDEESQIPPA